MREAMDKAAEQSLRAGQIIRRLRDFVSRGESERRIESINKLVEEASALALVGAKERGVRVRFELDPALDLVLADKVQIQQVMLNLMRNAIEAMEQSPRRDLVIATAARGGWWRSAWPTPAPASRRRSRRSCFSRSSPPSAWNGGRPVDLAHDHRGAWRPDLGRAQPGGRDGVSLHRACRDQGGSRRCRLAGPCHR